MRNTVIQFPCPCGHVFRLDDDQAGGLVQCPQCRRLNDVPLLGEQGQIGVDGTYTIEAQAHRTDPAKVAADLAYIYQKGALDADGNEIDLRTTPTELEAVGIGEPVPLAPTVPRLEHAPRYDPETGELISSLDVKQEGDPPINPADIPMAKTAINYASGATVIRPSFLRVFLNVLAPLNIAVMFAVFCMHLLLLPLLLVVFAGIMFLVVAVPFLAGAILAHYGNVIEDTGPHERDELPRPLRNVEWHEDLWSPFSNVLGSLLICYGPSFVAPLLAHRVPALMPFGLGLALVCAAIGTFFFPAVLLTLQCGGTSLNLRPDRIMTVIGACGKDYLITCVIWIFGGLLYLWGWGGTSLATADAMNPVNIPRWLVSWSFVVPALIAGIFAMHFFCMCMGMLYRLHYEKFPWVLQRHVRTKKNPQSAGLPPSRRRVRPTRVLPVERNG